VKFLLMAAALAGQTAMRLQTPPDGWAMAAQRQGRRLQSAPLGSARLAPDLMDMGFSEGSSSKRRPLAALDSSSWDWAEVEERATTPTLSDRRLVPLSQNSPTGRKAGQQGHSIAELGSRSYVQPLGKSPSADSFLHCRSISSPSRKQAEPMSRSSPEMDLKVTAKESILWLDELPKQERGPALAEMKQWVKSQGLDWELWWQYCQRARKEAAEGSPKRQAMKVASGPTFLGHPSGKASTQSMFNPVPAQMKSYNNQMKMRPNISRAQVQAGMTKQAIPAPQTESRPATSEGWQQVATEAMFWLQQKNNAERPAAMNEMRQWVIQSGLNWDNWWGYCRSLQDGKKTVDRRGITAPAGWSHEVSEDGSAPAVIATAIDEETPASDCSPLQNNRRGAFFVDAETIGEVRKEYEETEKDKRRKIKAEKKAREAAFQAAAEEWAAEEKIRKEIDDNWRSAIRQYSDEILQPAKKAINEE